MKHSPARTLRIAPLALAAALALAGPQVLALPTGAQVVSGQVSQSTPAAGQLLLNQGSARAIVDWRSFGIAAGESVRLTQPGGGMALFRVTGAEPSRIFGSLSASGSLFLLNPGGVFFGPNARVDVGSLTASTLGLGNDDFLNGRYRLAGTSTAAVENQGTISAAPGGSIVMLGRDVRNSGTLAAPGGTVALGAAGAATIDYYGNGLLRLNLGEGSDGASVAHSGSVLADGGAASFQALGRAALVNVSGLARAASLVERDGTVVLSAGPQGSVALSGTLDASATTGDHGGRIDVLGERITLAADSRLLADAGLRGSGGTVTAIASRDMRFDGRLSARGGALGGDGGSAEVSGLEMLTVGGGLADLSAAQGRFGTLLLDPGSITVQHGAAANTGPNAFDDGYIATQLGTASLTLATSGANNGAAESITVNGDVNIGWSRPTTLTLQAGRNIVVGGGAVIASSNAGAAAFDAIVLRANQSPTPTSGSFQGVSIGDGARLETAKGNLRITATGGDTGGFNHGIFLAGAPTIRSADGNIELTGRGGASTGSTNRGVSLEGNATVQVTGRGNLTLTGIGGGSGVASNSNSGLVAVSGSPSLATASGELRLTGSGSLGSNSLGIGSQVAMALNSTSGAITLQGSALSTATDAISLFSGANTVGSATTTGDITFTGDRLALANVTTRTTGTATFQPLTAGRPINIGAGDTNTSLGLAGVAELNQVTAGTIQVGNAQAGNVNLSAAFTPSGTSTLRLVSAGNITQTATAALNVANLGVRAVNVTLNNSNNAIGSLTATTTGAVQLNTTGNLTVADSQIAWSDTTSTRLSAGSELRLRNVTINSTNAGATPFDAIVLNGNQGPVQAAGGFSGIFLNSVDLQSATGNVRLAGRGGTGPGDFASGITTFTGNLSIRTVDGNIELTGVGGGDAAGQSNRGLDFEAATTLRSTGRGNISLSGTGGIGTAFNIGVGFTGGSATVSTNSGNIDIVGTGSNLRGSFGVVSQVVANIASTSGRTTITANAGPNVNGLSTISQSLSIGSAATSGDIFLNSDRIDLAGITLQTLGTVAVAPVTAGRAIGLGRIDSAATLGLTSAEINQITAGLLQVGNASAGPLSITSPIAPTGTGALALQSGSAITELGGGTLGVARLALAGTDINLPAANQVGTLSARGQGTLNVNNAQDLSIGTVGTLPAGVSSSGTVTLTAAGRRITLDQPVQSTATADAITLAADAFTNNAGAAGLLSPNGRWRVFSSDPANDQRGGLAFAFKRYDCVYNGACPAGIPANGNGFLYRLAPTLSVAPDAASSVYGDLPSLAGLGQTLSGFVDGDDASTAGIGGSATFTTPANGRSAVGSYDIAYASGLTSTLGYRFADQPAQRDELLVGKRPLTLTAAALSRPYGDATPARGAATDGGRGLVNGDSLSSVALTTPATAGSNVGTYELRASDAIFGTGLATNYTIDYATLADGLTVTPRPATITPTGNFSRPYGGGPFSFAVRASITAGSLAPGDQATNLNAAVGVVLLSSPVGAYSVPVAAATIVNTAGTNVAANYALTLNPVTLNVTRRPLTLTPETVSRLYGDANPATAGATSSSGFGFGLANGDRISQLTLASGATALSNVGSYPSQGSNAVFARGSFSNYDISYTDNPTGLQVTKRPLTITPGNVSRLYGDANPGAAAAVGNNLVNGDSLGTLTLGTAATAASNVGSHPTTGSNALFTSGLDSNYDVSFVANPTGLTINQRPLTITPDAVARLYGDANPATGSGTGNNLVNGDRIASVTLSTPATVASNVGVYETRAGNAVFASGLDSNYLISFAPNAAGLTINQRPLTITPDAVARLYGDANPATGTASGNNLVNGDTLASVTLSTPATVASNVGSYETRASNPVFASGLDSNYLISFAPNAAGLTINQRLLTITPDAVARLYGDANPATGTATGNNLVNGDSLASVTLTTPATVASNVGSYETRASNPVFASGLDSNYLIGFAPNPTGLAINQRPLTITPDAVARLYGDANPATGTASGNNLVNGDSLASVTLTTPATVASNVGSYETRASNPVFAGLDSNYLIGFAPNAAGLTINQRSLTITPDAVARLYGDANPATGTASGNNLVNGDTLASVTLSTPATVASNVGSYETRASNPVFASGLDSNYLIGFAPNPTGLAINQRPLTITPDAVARLYGDANPATGTASGNNLVNGDTLASVTLSTPATVASNVGSYETRASNPVFASGLDSNYLISFAPNPTGLAINQRPLTITPDAVARLYGDANPATGPASGNNLVNGDTLASVTLSTPATVASNVGAYETRASNPVFGTGLDSNYLIGFAPNPTGLTINQRPLTVTPDAVARLYGDANPATGPASGNNLVNGDSLASVTLTTPATVASNVGAYETRASNPVFGTGLDSNYLIGFAPNPTGLTINQRPLTITPDAVARLYGDANPATGTASGNDLVNGDTLASVKLSTPATAASNVGAYETRASNAVFASGLDSNYLIGFAPNAAGLTINQRPLTITPDAVARLYGDANPATGPASGNNLVNGDTLGSVTLTTPATVASNVGSYEARASNAVFASGLDSNYLIGFAPNATGLTINPHPLTITPDAVSRVYGDANPARGRATADDLVNGDTLASVALGTPATVASNVGVFESRGSNALFATGLDTNYAIRYAANASGLVITPRPIGVAPVPGQGKLAGAPEPVLQAQVVAGNLANDDPLTGALQRALGEAPGSYLIGQGSLTAGTNYTLTYTPGPFTIVSTLPGFVVDRAPAPGTALLAGNAFAALAPTAAGAPREVDLACVREQDLPGPDPARLVTRGMRLPPGVTDPCR